jgi:hypothetical protein
VSSQAAASPCALDASPSFRPASPRTLPRRGEASAFAAFFAARMLRPSSGTALLPSGSLIQISISTVRTTDYADYTGEADGAVSICAIRAPAVICVRCTQRPLYPAPAVLSGTAVLSGVICGSDHPPNPACPHPLPRRGAWCAPCPSRPSFFRKLKPIIQVERRQATQSLEVPLVVTDQ